MINTILFDLDDTLYPHNSGLSHALDQQMTGFVERVLGVDRAEAERLRRYYMAEFGTTMHGLQVEHGIDIESYMDHVHGVDIEAFLTANTRLDQELGALRARRAIFTNAPIEHANRVLAALAIGHHFEYRFDIRFAGFKPKPQLSYYQAALAVLDADPHTTALIEDTARNLPPAKSLGMTTLFIGATSVPAADYVVPDIYAALAQLRALGA
ncbi:MAG TPA: pyrimidine 5'-nucleotidase [Roseiflexaceae bacterium]|nr:pyrimidine 5'-nucleotidase [Roseiflexaceae bacterium]